MQNEYRYEKKFILKNNFNNIEGLLKKHPALFREIFYKRSINNIYFDTASFKFASQTINGECDRFKVRIRWYGDINKVVLKPVLEFKIKKTEMVKKQSFPLAPLDLSLSSFAKGLKKCLSQSKLPDDIFELVSSLNAVLINRYYRGYYLSRDNRFRVTLDRDVEYFPILGGVQIFKKFPAMYQEVVVELKYWKESEKLASRVTKHFNFPISKNSKYVRGLLKTGFVS